MGKSTIAISFPNIPILAQLDLKASLQASRWTSEASASFAWVQVVPLILQDYKTLYKVPLHVTVAAGQRMNRKCVLSYLKWEQTEKRTITLMPPEPTAPSTFISSCCSARSFSTFPPFLSRPFSQFPVRHAPPSGPTFSARLIFPSFVPAESLCLCRYVLSVLAESDLLMMDGGPLQSPACGRGSHFVTF